MNQLDFNAFFQQLSNVESIIFIAFCLGAFLIGLLFGMALRGVKIRRLKKELKKKDERISELETNLNEQAQIITTKEADLKKAAYDLNQVRLAADRYEEENAELNRQLLQLKATLDQQGSYGDTPDANYEALQARINQLEAENDALRNQSGEENIDGAKIHALQQQIEYLKNRNEQLQQEVESLKTGSSSNDSSRVQALQEQVAYLKNQNEELSERLAQPKYSAGGENASLSKDRMAAFEARLNQLENENASLKASIDRLAQGDQEIVTKSPVFEPTETDPVNQVEPDTNLIMQPKTDIFKSDRELLIDQSRDDLSRIEGVGPFIEKKLNDIGIYKFEQIAAWTDQDITRITQQLNYFEGRIAKDNWVGQAQALKDAPDVPEKDASLFEGTDPISENLTIVEGIGPKIEAILKNAGIMTLEQLAQADPADIERILEQADPRYQMHDPATWPAQARLAANGNWDVLEDYQEKLKGGRDLD